VTLQAGNKITLSSTGAGSVTIEAATSLTLKAPQVSIQATTSLELKSNATLSVSGTTVTIN